MKKSKNNNFTVYEEDDPCSLDEYSETLAEELENIIGNIEDVLQTLVTVEESE